MKKQSLTITIFGGTGDLAKIKLIKALFDLFKANLLPEKFRIIGFARGDFSHVSYRKFAEDILKDKKRLDVKEFISHIFYHQGDLNTHEDYLSLAERIGTMDTNAGECSNKIFYLAVPPTLYEMVFRNLSKSGMTVPCVSNKENENHWTRVLVEKPFGNDLKQAIKLDKLLGQLFEEDQIFRIDHYLAKETVQNILTFRFANSMFSPIWNKENIESVSIKIFETVDLKDRGMFFDHIGALRDVGQNHLLQMLALVAMEDPNNLLPNSIRNARADVLKNVRSFSKNSQEYLKRAQYIGYEKEKGVDNKTKTETYFKAKLRINNDRFKGVPFFIENGKALGQKKTEIEIIFKEKPNCMCPADDKRMHSNRLVFSIQPNEGITLHFWIKKPGFNYELEEKILSFNYDHDEFYLPDAYERVLFDCIKGDQTLFTSTEEIEAQWRIITPIHNDLSKVPLKKYRKGSNPEKI